MSSNVKAIKIQWLRLYLILTILEELIATAGAGDFFKAVTKAAPIIITKYTAPKIAANARTVSILLTD